MLDVLDGLLIERDDRAFASGRSKFRPIAGMAGRVYAVTDDSKRAACGGSSLNSDWIDAEAVGTKMKRRRAYPTGGPQQHQLTSGCFDVAPNRLTVYDQSINIIEIDGQKSATPRRLADSASAL